MTYNNKYIKIYVLHVYPTCHVLHFFKKNCIRVVSRVHASLINIIGAWIVNLIYINGYIVLGLEGHLVIDLNGINELLPPSRAFECVCHIWVVYFFISTNFQKWKSTVCHFNKILTRSIFSFLFLGRYFNIFLYRFRHQLPRSFVDNLKHW